MYSRGRERKKDRNSPLRGESGGKQFSVRSLWEERLVLYSELFERPVSQVFCKEVQITSSDPA